MRAFDRCCFEMMWAEVGGTKTTDRDNCLAKTSEARVGHGKTQQQLLHAAALQPLLQRAEGAHEIAEEEEATLRNNIITINPSFFPSHHVTDFCVSEIYTGRGRSGVCYTAVAWLLQVAVHSGAGTVARNLP